MPRWLEKRLASEARKDHLTGKRKNAYIYGTLLKIEKLEKKHDNRNRRRTNKRRSKRA